MTTLFFAFSHLHILTFHEQIYLTLTSSTWWWVSITCNYASTWLAACTSLIHHFISLISWLATKYDLFSNNCRQFMAGSSEECVIWANQSAQSLWQADKQCMPLSSQSLALPVNALELIEMGRVEFNWIQFNSFSLASQFYFTLSKSTCSEVHLIS